MAEGILTALFKPDEFFEGKSKTEVFLSIPLGIVCVYALLSGIAGYQMAVLMAPMYEIIAEGYGEIIAIFGAIGGFIGAALTWVIISVIFFLLSMLFRGEGSMKKVLEVVGYGFTPLIAVAGIGVAYLAMIADQIQVTIVYDIMDPGAIEAAVEEFMTQPAMQEYTLLITVISVIFTIWAANIWYYGIRHARNLTARDAGITVLVPVAIYLIVIIVTSGVFV